MFLPTSLKIKNPLKFPTIYFQVFLKMNRIRNILIKFLSIWNNHVVLFLICRQAFKPCLNFECFNAFFSQFLLSPFPCKELMVEYTTKLFLLVSTRMKNILDSTCAWKVLYHNPKLDIYIFLTCLKWTNSWFLPWFYMWYMLCLSSAFVI